MKSVLIFFVSFLCCLPVLAEVGPPVRISVTDFGVEPGTRTDALPAVRRALEECRKYDCATLVFPKGRYDFFSPKGTDRFALPLDRLENFTLDGQGSEFIFHGLMGVAAVRDSRNTTLRNFTVDWEVPFIAQGTIIDTQDDYVDIRFDLRQHEIDIDSNGRLRFSVPGIEGKNEWRPVAGYTLLFDKEHRDLVPRTRDNALGGNELFNTRAQWIGTPADRLVRFHGKPKMKPEPGTIIALWLGRYVHVAFDLKHSKDVTLEDITVFHSLSHAVVGFKTENITLRRFAMEPNRDKGRVFSLVADGFHLNTCRGKVLVEDCRHFGAGDDFLNLHGMNVLVQKRIDDRTVEVAVTGKPGASYVLGTGDEVWFIDGETVQRVGTGRIREIKEIHLDGKLVAKHFVFEEPLPETLRENDALENKTWNAELTVRGCKIGRSHRARGILVTTPLKTLIEKNEFFTAGAAILIEGDVNFWFESGAVTDIEISDNLFRDCFSSALAGDWGHAVITIHPSFQPKSENDPPYHRNIRITGNEFRVFDYPLLFARSTASLAFVGNTIAATKTYEPFATHKATFWLDGCRETLIEENRWEGNVPGRNVKMFHMKPGDLILKDQEITIDP